MALTRSQLLAGDSSQGIVLPGNVQGVKQGVGVVILPDGTINFDATTATGVMRLNNAGAYNAYVWPTLAGAPAANTILQSDGAGGLVWTANYVPTDSPTGAAQLPVGITTQRPLAASVGQIRYNSTTGKFEGYGGTVPVWASIGGVTEGLGIDITGDVVKLEVPIQFGPPPAGTLPAEAIDGSLYWDNNLGLLFIRYNDGTSTQWVQVIPTGGGGGTGTVTSVGIIGTSGIGVVSGSPVTSAGNITLAIDIATLPVLP